MKGLARLASDAERKEEDKVEAALTSLPVPPLCFAFFPFYPLAILPRTL
jgi:hypothetical protein